MNDLDIKYNIEHSDNEHSKKNYLGRCGFGEVLLQGDFAEGLLIGRDVDRYQAGKGRLELVLGNHRHVVAADPVE